MKKIEEEYDITVGEEAYQEYVDSGKESSPISVTLGGARSYDLQVWKLLREFKKELQKTGSIYDKKMNKSLD